MQRDDRYMPIVSQSTDITLGWLGGQLLSREIADHISPLTPPLLHSMGWAEVF